MHSTFSLIVAIAFSGAEEPKGLEVRVPERVEPISYALEVIDLLEAKCVGCHSTVLAEKDLILEDVAGMLKGGESGPSIVAGKADESLLFRMAAHRVEPVMPPKEKAELKAMTPDELGLLKLWIDQGARDDSSEAEPAAAGLVLGPLPAGLRSVLALDFAPDGSRLAAGRANFVQIYEPQTGVEVVRLGGHEDLVQSLRFSRDGTKLAAGSYQIVTLWDAPKGESGLTFKGHGEPVTAIAATVDGGTFVTGSLDRTIRVWAADREQPIRPIDAGAPVHALALGRSGERLAAACGDGHVRGWGMGDGAMVFDLAGEGGAARSIAFGPDEESLAAGFEDGSIRVWNLGGALETGAGSPTILAGHSGSVRGLGFVGRGRIVSAGMDGTVRTWELADGRNASAWNVHSKAILSLSVSPDGSLALTGSEDGTARLVDLGDGATGPPLTGHLGPIHAVAFAPDGRHFATAGREGAVKVWRSDPASGVVAFAHKEAEQDAQAVEAIAFAGNGTVVSGSADRTARAWGFAGEWALARTIGPHVFRVLALDFSPDHTLLAAGGGEPSRSGEIKLWAVGTGELVRAIDDRHSDTVLALRFSPDGTRLASGAADKFVKVSLVPKGEVQRSFEGHTHHVLAVDWKDDGKQLASGGADQVAKIWELETGEQLRTTQAAGNQVTGLRWLTGQPSIAAASGDRLVHLWNAENGQRQRSYSGPADYLYAVAVPSDGKRVAAAGEDGAIYVWRVENGQVLRKIEPPVLSADSSGRPDVVAP